jgi:hypothetical protein
MSHNQQAAAIDQNDVNDWVNRFNAALADTTSVTAPSGPDARPWAEAFFGCFSPIDTCTLECPIVNRDV